MSHATTDHRSGTERHHHSIADGARAGAAAGLAAALVNAVVFGLGSLAGTAWEVDSNGTVTAVPLAGVIIASVVVPVLAGIVLAFLAGRWSGASRAWTPFVLAIGVLSLGGVLGAADVATGVSLGIMHLVVAAVAAFVIPGRLDR